MKQNSEDCTPFIKGYMGLSINKVYSLKIRGTSWGRAVPSSGTNWLGRPAEVVFLLLSCLLL